MYPGYVEYINSNHASIIALLKDLISDELQILIQVASCDTIVFTSFNGSIVRAVDLSQLATLKEALIDILVHEADACLDAIGYDVCHATAVMVKWHFWQ